MEGYNNAMNKIAAPSYPVARTGSVLPGGLKKWKNGAWYPWDEMCFDLFFSRSDRSAASISLTTYQRRAALASIYSFGRDIVRAERPAREYNVWFHPRWELGG